MIVYLVVREETTLPFRNEFFVWVLRQFGLYRKFRFTILALHSSKDSANGMIDTHVKARIEEGAVQLRNTTIAPEPFITGTMIRVGGTSNLPLLVPAPEIVSCCIREVELVGVDGKSRTQYRIIQDYVVMSDCTHDYRNFTSCIHCKERP